MIAERNARRKGHPNYFTDLHKMKNLLNENGVSIIHECYQLRRQDAELNKFCQEEPDKFYIWELILRKDAHKSVYAFDKFSDAYSETWKEVGWAD